MVYSSGYCLSETQCRIFAAGFEQWPRDTIAHCVSNALSNPVGVVAQLISNVDLSRDCSVAVAIAFLLNLNCQREDILLKLK